MLVALLEGGVNVDATTGRGNTPLMYVSDPYLHSKREYFPCIQNVTFSTCTRQLEGIQNASRFAPPIRIRNPLTDFKSLQVLLSNGANPCVQSHHDGDTPLHKVSSVVLE